MTPDRPELSKTDFPNADPAERASLAATLLRVLEARTGKEGLAYARAPRLLARGATALCYHFRLASAPPGLGQDLVLRLMLHEPVSLKELTVQRTLADMGFKTPRVHCSGGPDEGFGKPFVIMDRAPGRVLVRHGWSAMGTRLAEVMSELHSIDPQPVIDALEAAGVSPESVSLEATFSGLEEVATALPLRGFREGIEWLNERRSPPERHAVCHGDLHPLNVVLEDGRAPALLDWGSVRIAEPAFDVAVTFAALSQRPLIGRRAAQRFLDSYGRLRPLPQPAALRWHQALYCYKILTRVAAWRLDTTQPVKIPAWEVQDKGYTRLFREITDVTVRIPSTRLFRAKWLGRIVLIQI